MRWWRFALAPRRGCVPIKSAGRPLGPGGVPYLPQNPRTPGGGCGAAAGCPSHCIPWREWIDVACASDGGGDLTSNVTAMARPLIGMRVHDVYPLCKVLSIRILRVKDLRFLGLRAHGLGLGFFRLEGLRCGVLRLFSLWWRIGVCFEQHTQDFVDKNKEMDEAAKAISALGLGFRV